MRRRPQLSALLALALLACGCSSSPETKAPEDAKPPADTATSDIPGLDAKAQEQPSYLQFAAWLDSFNAGDVERHEAFLTTAFPSNERPAQQQMQFRAMTGGFDLRKIEEASATEVVGLVEERDSDNFARFKVVVGPDAPNAILEMDLDLIPRPDEFPIPTLTQGEAVDALRAQIDKRSAAGEFSGAVLLARNDEVLLSEARGLADREKKIENTPDTSFRIGSMNKMFTGVAVLQLVQAGKLQLDAPVGKYLTKYPNEDTAQKVTIHQLLTHTGGTGDFFGPEFEEHRLELKTHADYIKLLGDRPPEFEPGTEWRYSNFGMLMLGRVIEKVSGHSYYDYVREHIYAPAQMTGTGSEPEEVEVAKRSRGYMKPRGAAEHELNTDTLPYRGTAAGGGYSTVEDLHRFARALLGHELLDAKHTELLITTKAETPIGGYAYGFIDARDEDGNGWVGHQGGAPGMNGDFQIFPKTGYVVTALANVDPPAASRLTQWVGARLPTE